MSHTCEPPYYPTDLTESWNCPDCGTEYAAWDPFIEPPTFPFTPHFLPNVLGWIAYAGRKQ